jgi:hypothetical protein
MRSFGVVILITDPETARRGVAYDKVGAKLADLLQHEVYPRAIVRKDGVLAKAKVGGQGRQFGRVHAFPSPTEVGGHIGGTILLIKVEDAPLRGLEAQEGLPRRYSDG